MAPAAVDEMENNNDCLGSLVIVVMILLVHDVDSIDSLVSMLLLFSLNEYIRVRPVIRVGLAVASFDL